MGLLTTFFDYMSEFYALWFAVIIKQIIKDPIHKLQKLILFFHVITFIVSAFLTGVLAQFNTFGVQVSILPSFGDTQLGRSTMRDNVYARA